MLQSIRTSIRAHATARTSPRGIVRAARLSKLLVRASQQEPNNQPKVDKPKPTAGRRLREAAAVAILLLVAFVNKDQMYAVFSPLVATMAATMMGNASLTEGVLGLRVAASWVGLLLAAVIASWNFLQTLPLRVDTFFENVDAIPALGTTMDANLKQLDAKIDTFNSQLHAKVDTFNSQLHAKVDELDVKVTRMDNKHMTVLQLLLLLDLAPRGAVEELLRVKQKSM